MTNVLIEKLKKEIAEGEAVLENIENMPSLFTLHTGTMAGLNMALDIVKEHSEQVCRWRNNKGTDAWSEWSDCGDYTSDCGLEWNISNDDSPTENEMNFCPKCGRKLVEIQPPSEVQS